MCFCLFSSGSGLTPSVRQGACFALHLQCEPAYFRSIAPSSCACVCASVQTSVKSTLLVYAAAADWCSAQQQLQATTAYDIQQCACTLRYVRSAILQCLICHKKTAITSFCKASHHCTAVTLKTNIVISVLLHLHSCLQTGMICKACLFSAYYHYDYDYLHQYHRYCCILTFVVVVIVIVTATCLCCCCYCFNSITVVILTIKWLASTQNAYEALLRGIVLQAGVKMIEGRGRVLDAHTVRVKDKTYTVGHWMQPSSIHTSCALSVCTGLAARLLQQMPCMPLLTVSWAFIHSFHSLKTHAT